MTTVFIDLQNLNQSFYQFIILENNGQRHFKIIPTDY